MSALRQSDAAPRQSDAAPRQSDAAPRQSDAAPRQSDVAVSVKDLVMTYRVPVRDTGVRAAIVSLVRRRYRQVEAVKGITFALEPGAVVGFIGPNGAGKTTTLKILSGILHPTGGDVRVLGHVPWQRERDLLRRIAMIRGSQPLSSPAELTVLDALRFQQLIYEVPDDTFRRNLTELSELLDLGPLLDRQARALSLGERMRAGLAVSLLYRPRVLFLDEPTIGLDVSAVGMLRRFIGDYARQVGAAVLLTSHYMADVEALCRRILLIDHGVLRYDGDLAGLATALSPYKLLTVALTDGAGADWGCYGEVVDDGGLRESGRVALRVRREQVPATTARLLAELPVADLAVEDAPLETVIDQVYREVSTLDKEVV